MARKFPLSEFQVKDIEMRIIVLKPPQKRTQRRANLLFRRESGGFLR